MPIRLLGTLGEKVCRMPVFPSRKRPNWHRWCNLFASFAPGVDQLRVVLLVVPREVGHVIREGREGRKGSAMPIRFLGALGEKVCRMPVFPSRKTPKRPRFSRLFAPFAPGVDQLRVVLLVIMAGWAYCTWCWEFKQGSDLERYGKPGYVPQRKRRMSC